MLKLRKICHFEIDGSSMSRKSWVIPMFVCIILSYNIRRRNAVLHLMLDPSDSSPGSPLLWCHDASVFCFVFQLGNSSWEFKTWTPLWFSIWLEAYVALKSALVPVFLHSLFNWTLTASQMVTFPFSLEDAMSLFSKKKFYISIYLTTQFSTWSLLNEHWPREVDMI